MSDLLSASEYCAKFITASSSSVFILSFVISVFVYFNLNKNQAGVGCGVGEVVGNFVVGTSVGCIVGDVDGVPVVGRSVG